MRTQSDRDPQQLELFGHRRVTAGRVFFGRARARFNRWLTWYSALSRPGVYAVQTAAVLIGLMVYGGVLLGIWHRGVASDMKRALAHSTNLPASSPQPARRVAPQSRVPPPSTPLAEAPPSAPVAAPTPAPAAVAAPARASTAVPAPTAAPAPVAALHTPKRESRSPTPKRPLPRVTPVQRPQPRLADPRVAHSASPEVVVPPPSTAPLIPTVATAPAVVAEVSPAAPAMPAESVTREPASRDPDPLAADHSAVNAVLAAYRKSYNNLDATSAAAIWRGVDVQALRRAFGSLSRQNLRFDRCDVRVVAADRAVARCDGLLSYVPKVGDATPQERRLAYTISLQRAAERWLIAEVTAR